MKFRKFMGSKIAALINCCALLLVMQTANSAKKLLRWVACSKDMAVYNTFQPCFSVYNCYGKVCTDSLSCYCD